MPVLSPREAFLQQQQKMEEMERDLAAWVVMQKARSGRVTDSEICTQALELYHRRNAINNFQPNPQWLVSFKDRLAQATNDEEMTQDEIAARVCTFLFSLHSIITEHFKFPACAVGTVFALPVSLTLPGFVHQYCDFDQCIDVQGGDAADQTFKFLVILSAVATGEKLKPIILLDVDLPPNASFPDEVIVRTDTSVDLNNRLNDSEFCEWKNSVWLQRRESVLGRQGLVFVDTTEFNITLTPSVRRPIFMHNNTAIAPFPKGLSNILHPAVMYWIKPFGEMIRVRLEEWLEDSEEQWKTIKRKRMVNLELFTFWVAESWNEIAEEMIIGSFELCGLTSYRPIPLHAQLQELVNRCENPHNGNTPVVLD